MIFAKTMHRFASIYSIRCLKNVYYIFNWHHKHLSLSKHLGFLSTQALTTILRTPVLITKLFFERKVSSTFFKDETSIFFDSQLEHDLKNGTMTNAYNNLFHQWKFRPPSKMHIISGEISSSSLASKPK